MISYLGILENLNASDLDINDFIENPFAKKNYNLYRKMGWKWVIMARRSVMKLHRMDIASDEIDLSPIADTPGHKHKPDMDKGTYELRVEHDQDTDGAINIDDVMGVLSLSRGYITNNE